MRVVFRPLVGFSIASLVAFAILTGLGVWQLERLQWKLDLIASVNRNLAAAPISLSRAAAMGVSAQYHRVALDGQFENEKESYVFSTDRDGSPAFHVIVPFETTLGTILVDRGIIPYSTKPRAYAEGEVTGPMRIVGVWRAPEGPGLFTPAPNPAARIWYSRDVNAIAQADHVKLLAPVLIEADATPNRGGWPKGGQTEVHFRNEHLQYAITWFALAAGLLAIYFAYHRAKGRLGFD